MPRLPPAHLQARSRSQPECLPKCQHHFKISAQQRIELLLEPGYELVDAGLRSTDPLNFSDVKPYKQRLRAREADRPRRRDRECPGTNGYRTTSC
jgi:acetyl-CoA carboxylase carboxyl transferase subunit beta